MVSQIFFGKHGYTIGYMLERKKNHGKKRNHGMGHEHMNKRQWVDYV